MQTEKQLQNEKFFNGHVEILENGCKCLHCGKTYKGQGTAHMRSHLRTAHNFRAEFTPENKLQYPAWW